MDSPYNHKDVLWRNHLLLTATKRSSTMLLQQAGAANPNFHGYHDPRLSLPHYGGALRQAPSGVVSNHFGPLPTSDPNQASMLRLMMLRNQARDAFKMQNQAVLRQNPQTRPIAPPRQTIGASLRPSFIPIAPKKPLPSMDVPGYLDKPASHSRLAESTTLIEELHQLEHMSRRRDYSPSDIDSSFSPSIEKLTTTEPVKNPKAAKKEGKKNANQKDSKWLASLAQLVAYKEEFGDCIVPRGYASNPRLASWVAEQRKQYKLLQDGKPSSITPERIERLEKLDFAWNAQDAAWERHLEDLKKFRDEFGDCLVPLANPTFPRLGLWIKEQRRHYTLLKQGKKSHMTEERALKLDRIGFCWDTHEQIWGDRLRELCAYRAVHGDSMVPTNYTKNRQLGTWTHHQRRQYKKFTQGKPCHITMDRIRALESLGFVWDPRTKQDNLSLSDDNESASDDSSSYSSLDRRPSKRQKTA